MPNIDNYWNRYDAGKNYTELLFRDGYGTQASEHNEMQSIIFARMARLAKAMFKDGDILADAQIAVDESTGLVRAAAGEVCLAGAVWSVPAKEFTIPATGTVSVGVRLKESIVSELEDPGLRNPATGSRGEGEPGAWRRRIEPVWGYDSDGGDGDFFPVYVVEDGVQRAKEAPPSLDAFNQALARYDRDSTGTGTYAVSGLMLVAGDDLADGRQVYHLSEGRARVDGMGVEMNTSRRVVYDAAPDLRLIDTEVHAATADSATGGQRITLAHPPMKNVTALRITTESTESVVHGAYSGALDTLANTSVASIVSVSQGDTTFVAGTDYTKNGDRVDWSPSGNEPAPGSTYTVTYQHITAVEPGNPDVDGFTVTGAVAGTSILLSYNQMLPRYDRLALTYEGVLTWFKGVASETSPQKPTVPDTMLALATVYQSWRPNRTVTNDAVRVVQFDEITRINNRVDYALQEIARQRLESDVATRESGARVGLFVDPLLDDSMRDQGVTQTAAIVDGCLTLPITNARASRLSLDVAAMTARPYSVSVLLEQPYRTTDMAVNPYQAFEPLPAKVTLTPAVDHWTDVQTMWASAVTQTFKRSTGTGGGSGWAVLHHTETNTTTQALSSSTTLAENLRQIDVSFEIEGFGPGEALESVTFDGVEVTPSSN